MKLPVQNFCEESQQSNLKVGVCVGVYSVVCLHHDKPKMENIARKIKLQFFS